MKTLHATGLFSKHERDQASECAMRKIVQGASNVWIEIVWTEWNRAAIGPIVGYWVRHEEEET